MPGLRNIGTVLREGAERVRPIVREAAQSARSESGVVTKLRAMRGSSARAAAGAIPAPRPFNWADDAAAAWGPSDPALRTRPKLKTKRPQYRTPAGTYGKGAGTPGGPLIDHPMPMRPKSSGAAGSAQPSWIRRNPGKALGIGAVGLGAMNLRRNTGPGVTGNGYRPPGARSGGRGF